LGRKYLPIVEALLTGSWASIPHPDGRRSVVHGPGPDPDRILLAGGSSAVGWGVISHELALAGYLSRMISATTGRGTDVEVLAGPEITVRDIAAHLTQGVVSRYDAIVLTLGTREAFEFIPIDLWSQALGGLIDQIGAANNDPPSVVVVGAEQVSPMPMPSWFTARVMRRTGQINTASQEVVAGHRRVVYLNSAMVPTPGERGVFDASHSAVYRKAAEAIVPVLAPLLQQGHRRQTHPVNDALRRSALAHLTPFRGDLSPVTELLERLRRALGVRSADLYVVDRDTVHTLAATVDPPESRQRSSSISTMALEYRSGLVVPDTLLDGRFRDRPEVTGEPYLRFYAAHPVESPEGHRVAVLSVVHNEPVAFTPADFALLRTVAIRIGDALFAGF